MPTYIANRLSADSNLLFPDRLDVEPDRIVYYKASVIGYRSLTVPRVQISSVSVRYGLLFAYVVIESSGGRRIEIKGLSKSDAREIDEMLRG